MLWLVALDFVSACSFVPPRCGFSLSLFCDSCCGQPRPTQATGPCLPGVGMSMHVGVNVNVNVNNLLAISESDFDNSGEPGPQAEGVNHLENPPQTTARNSQGVLLCSARWSHAIVFETQGRTRNRAQDLPNKGSALIRCMHHTMACTTQWHAPCRVWVMMVGCFCAEACTAAVLIGVVRLPGCPFGSA